jgi:hypothetical protein
MLLRDADLAWLLSLPTRGRYGRASLPPAPTYGLPPSDEGTWLLAWRRLVTSCSNGRWRFTRDMQPLGWLGYSRWCLTAWISSNIEHLPKFYP